MKFLADVNIDREIVRRLRADGHEVHWLAEDTRERELQDPLVIAFAYQEGAIILTKDRGYVGWVFRDRLPTHGVVLSRVAIVRSPRPQQMQRIYEAIHTSLDQLAGNFTTVYPDHVEQTPLPPRPAAST